MCNTGSRMTPFPPTTHVLNLLEEPKDWAALCLLFFSAEVRTALLADAQPGLNNRIPVFPITTACGCNSNKN